MPLFIEGKNLDFQNDTAVNMDSRGGFGIGFGYNFDAHMELSCIFSATSSSYVATRKDSNGSTSRASSNLYTSTIATEATYNFLEDEFTPYVSLNLGFTYIDTGISVDERPGMCYWDPWFGYVCYDNTYTATKLNYGGTLGLRYDFANVLFIKGGVSLQYLDINSKTSPYFTTYVFSIGARF